MGLPAIIIFCLLLFGYFIYIKRKGADKLALALALLYLFSALTSIIVFQGKPERFESVNIFSYVVLFVFLVISFYPIYRHRKKSYSGVRYLSATASHTIAIVLIALNIPVAIDIIPRAISTYQTMLLDFAIATEMYEETADMVRAQTGSSFEHVADVLRGLSAGIIIFYSFYYLCYPNRKKILLILLWICVFLPIPASLLSASRTGLSYWALEMLISFSIFSGGMGDKPKRRIKTVMLTFGVFLILVFGALTIGRFGASEYNANDNAGSSVAEYFGQGTINFSADVLQNDTYQWGDGTMPFFRQILGLSFSKNIYERQEKWGRVMSIEQGAFYTYIGDLCNDFSPYLTFVLLIIFTAFFDSIINKKECGNVINTSQLFLYFILCGICFDGIFYYSYKTMGGNLKLIANVLFYILLCVNGIRNGRIVNNEIKV